MNKKIIIKIFYNNSQVNNYFYEIYSKNELIKKGYTNNTQTTISGEVNKGYMIIFYFNNICYKTAFIITPQKENYYFYIFNYTSKIRITLSDSNYNQLKIKGGIIYLWPNHTQ